MSFIQALASSVIFAPIAAVATAAKGAELGAKGVYAASGRQAADEKMAADLTEQKRLQDEEIQRRKDEQTSLQNQQQQQKDGEANLAAGTARRRIGRQQAQDSRSTILSSPIGASYADSTPGVGRKTLLGG